jgi:non-ribosomal peptide synthase protein (TIGR01720 family)
MKMTGSNEGWERSMNSVSELCRTRAARNGSDLAYRFLVQGDVTGAIEVITYAELWQRVRAVAVQLQESDIRQQRVLLLFPSGLDFVCAFLGCLAAGAIAVPAHLPEHLLTATRSPGDPALARLRGIAEDSGAVALLTHDRLLARREQAVALLPQLSALRWYGVTKDVSTADAWRDPSVSAGEVAFLQYTSGSTGNPKGVMVTHQNVLANCEAIRLATGIGREDSYVSWLPLFHDMGLIGGVMQPLYMGGTMTLMSPLAFLQRPERWLRAISHFRATGSSGSNFAFDLVVKRTSPAARNDLDLACWKRVSNGAEPIDAATVDRFVEAFGPVGFSKTAMMPCYGLAESTLAVTFAQRGAYRVFHADAEGLTRDGVLSPASMEGASVRSLVSCGRPVHGHRVLICDPDTRVPRGPGEVGEIWVQGPSVTRGYWNAEEISRETFGAHAEGLSNNQGFLRTGDMGVLVEGELFVTGRYKEMMIFDGANHFPQDIEATVASVIEQWNVEGRARLRAERCVAFSEQVQGSERLWVAAEALEHADFEGVARDLAAAISSAHGLRLYGFAALEKKTLTRTSSGKPERASFRQRFLEQRVRPLAVVRLDARRSDAPPSTSMPSKLSQTQWTEWLTTEISAFSGVAAASIDVHQPLTALGISSKDLVQLSGLLEERASCSLPPSLLYDHPTISKLAAHLAGVHTPSNVHSPAAERLDVRDLDIAVVGMDCQFPGASSLEELWLLLREGRSAVSRVPHERWSRERVEVLANGDADVIARASFGAFLAQVPVLDHAFFGISARESAAMDPQHKLLLEGAWHALEHAGIAPSSLCGTRTGVFVGISQSDFAQLAATKPGGALDLYNATGSAASLAANRLSYLLDLRGPSLAIDTACSSSLTALALGAQALARGDADLAVIGGVNLLLSPELSVAFARARMLSPSGACHTFDAAADGYVRGEGCGVVVLERLSDALRAGRRVLAVVRGAALGQDGLSNGLTAPNGDAQEAVIRRALELARSAPADIDYIEAHGTGTPLGDPIELNALGRIFGMDSSSGCEVGSIKTNLGHLEAAAGIAGVIKAVLMLQHGESVPHASFEHPNPHLTEAARRLHISRAASRWNQSSRPRRIGVSAFGFGGANAHVVLEQAPLAEPAAAVTAERGFVIPLSAKSQAALAATVAAHAAWLEAHPDARLVDIAHTAGLGRAHHRSRVAVVAQDVASAAQALRSRSADLAERSPASTSNSTPPVIALVTGQGAQYPGMAAELYALDSTFQSALVRAARAAEPWLPGPLLPALLEPDANYIRETLWAQPALVAYNYAAAQMWEAWGISPVAYLGHSVGEIGAAVLAGMLSLEDAMRFVCRRGACMQSLGVEGGMAAVSASAVEVQALLQEGELEIAALNTPSSTVVSGRLEALEGFITRARSRGLTVDRLEVSHAFHSELLEPILGVLREAASEVAWQAPTRAVISNLSGDFHSDGAPDPDYFARHAREPVRFFQGVAALRARYGADAVFLELGPHPVLTALARASSPGTKCEFLFSARRNQRGPAPALLAAAKLYELGHELKWSALVGSGGRVVSLPSTHFEHETKPSLPKLAAEPSTPDAAMLSYYRALSQSERGRDDQDLLNFAPFPEVRPGFSWVKVFCDPRAFPAETQEIALRHEEFRSFLFSHIDFDKVRRVVDVGCGFAADLIALARRYPHCELHGFNISPDQIETGRRRCREAGLDGRIQLFCANSATDAFHGPYELGIAFQVMHHIVDKAAVFRNLSANLVPGGHVVFAEVLSNTASSIDDEESSAHFAPLDTWAKALAEANLRVVDCVDMSVEVANFLYDPEWEHNFAQAASGLDPATRAHLIGPHKLGELLRRQLAIYGLLRVVKDVGSTHAALSLANGRALAERSAYATHGRGSAAAAVNPNHATVSAPPAKPSRFELSRDAWRALPVEARTEAVARFVRAEVSKVLGARPAELRDDQPLVDLGFDSLMALELKNALERAFSVTLSAQLFTRTLALGELVPYLVGSIDETTLPAAPSLAGEVAAVPQKTVGNPQAELAVPSATVLPTAAQVRFFEQSLTDAHTWNLANPALTVTPRVDAALLHASVRHLVERHEALRLRAAADHNLHLAPVADCFEVRQIDMRSVAQAQGQEAAFKHAARQLHQAPPDSPLLRVALVELNDAEPQLLLIAAHHLLMDAFSFGIFVQECKVVYGALARGQTPELPAPTSAYREATRLLHEAVHQPAVRQELPSWQRVLAGGAGRLPRDLAAGPNDWQSAARVRWQASASETEALLAAAQRQQLNLEEVLSAALGRVLARWTGERRFVIDRVGHGRFSPIPGLDLSRTIGWFNTVFPFVIEEADRIDAATLRRQREALPDGGVGYSLLRYLGTWASRTVLSDAPQAELSCNYLGNIDQLWFVGGTSGQRDAPEFGLSKHDILPFHRGGRTERRYLLDVVGSISSACFSIDVSYSRHVHHASTIERLTADLGAQVLALRT